MKKQRGHFDMNFIWPFVLTIGMAFQGVAIWLFYLVYHMVK